MAGIQHTFGAAEGFGTLLAAATVASDGTATNTSHPGTSDISTAKSATGVYTVTINPFRARRAVCIPVATVAGGKGFIEVDDPVYTNDSVVITVKTWKASDASAEDHEFFIQVLAF